ncbi:hypothetical protein FRC12_001767 [Ceratobasidium sp. 428]|nr:hypothetical protein FRC12_001767 [Ceratobasidium sp. 428]
MHLNERPSQHLCSGPQHRNISIFHDVQPRFYGKGYFSKCCATDRPYSRFDQLAEPRQANVVLENVTVPLTGGSKSSYALSMSSVMAIVSFWRGDLQMYGRSFVRNE